MIATRCRPRIAARRSRRTAAEIGRIKKAIYDIAAEERPVTIRQLFYRLVARGAIGKTENEYKDTVIRLAAKMRLDGELPFDWIADNTRWMRKPTTHGSMEIALAETRNCYRRAVWQDQSVNVEIWTEKDAIAGVLFDVTGKWDVPLMVARGYPSLTFLHSAGQAIEAQRKPCFLYYFGDHDPSGADIDRNIEQRLREFAPGAEITFERVAVLPEQIAKWDLPTRPTKKTDSRAKDFEGTSVDVDAIPSRRLRELCEQCIVQHIDPDIYDRTMNIERLERAGLDEFLAGWKGNQTPPNVSAAGDDDECPWEDGK